MKKTERRRKGNFQKLKEAGKEIQKCTIDEKLSAIWKEVFMQNDD
jgi:hypothetical protein